MNYRQLLEELKKLSPEQLNQQVLIDQEDMPVSALSRVFVVEEDCINPTGEGAEYISAYTDPGIADDPMTEEEARAEFPVCIKKGSVYLMAGVRSCRVCGCTDNCACPGGCYWVEKDLCSNCKEMLDQGLTVEDIQNGCWIQEDE